MNDASNLRDTIAPKSDQLNADDLIAGPITVTIQGVRRGAQDQPVVIDIDGGYQPYKPCKSMRRVMIAAWGDNGHKWVGQSMTLYNDPTVKFGKVAMGGIRISNMTGLNDTMHMMLTTTRARRANYKVDPLVMQAPEPVFDADAFGSAAAANVAECKNLDDLKAVFAEGYRGLNNFPQHQKSLKAVYDDCKQALENK